MAGDSGFAQVVDLAGHLAWPAAAVGAVAVFRAEIQGLMTAVRRRVEDPRTSVSVGRDGFEISTRQDANEAKLTSLEFDIEQVKQLVLPVDAGQMIGSRGSTIEASADGVPSELTDMAERYLNISLPNWSERVRAKDSAAREMANIVLTRGVSKDALAGQHHEGLILALAAAVHARPEVGDLDRLFRVCDEVNRLHVKYRIVLALGRLVERGFAFISDFARIEILLQHYREDADEALRQRIRQTEALLRRVRDGGQPTVTPM